MSRAERLSDLIKARSQAEASIKVFAQATYFPGFVRLYQPHKPTDKLIPGFESEPLKKRSSQLIQVSDNSEDNLQRSLRTTKASVIAYALCNPYDLFATFTFSDDRQNVDRSKQKMNDWLKNQKKRTSPNLKYLIVSEFHHDGVSLHFHALLSGYLGGLKVAINPETGKPRKRGGRIRYNITSFQSGYTDAVKLGQTFEDQQKVGRYISKYITKDMPRFKNKNRYWASSGLARPLKEYNPPVELLTQPPIWQKTNEYGTVSIFPYTGELTEYLDSKGYHFSSGVTLK